MKYLYKCVKILQSKITEKPLEKFGTRVATVNWMWNSRTFPRLFRTFSSKFKDLLVQKKALLFCILIQQWVLQDLLLGKNQASILVFIHCYIKGIMSGFWQTAHFNYYLQNFEDFHSFQDFQGLQPKFKDFPVPWIFFCQFQDFPGFSRTMATLWNIWNTFKNVLIDLFLSLNSSEDFRKSSENIGNDQEIVRNDWNRKY